MADYSIKRFSAYSNAELRGALRKFAASKNAAHVSSRAFSEATGIAEATVINHFGSWREFCAQAGLAPRYQRTVSHQILFENLERVWQQLGRQPRAKEMKQPLSYISISRYQKAFNEPWYRLCLQFLSWKSGAPVSEIEREAAAAPSSTQKPRGSRREVTLSLRYAILKRDRFRCVKCGASPATNPATQLHVDHVIAWANRGETILQNLQSLCSDCNLGKSNRHDG